MLMVIAVWRSFLMLRSRIFLPLTALISSFQTVRLEVHYLRLIFLKVVSYADAVQTAQSSDVAIVIVFYCHLSVLFVNN